MSIKYKVLRAGILQRDGEQWLQPKIDDLIDLSDAAARYLLEASPPFVERVVEEPPRRISRLREKEE